jgi:hypothetical protein
MRLAARGDEGPERGHSVKGKDRVKKPAKSAGARSSA